MSLFPPCFAPHRRRVMRVFTLIEMRESCAEESRSTSGVAHQTKSRRHTWTNSIIRSHWLSSFWFTSLLKKFGAQTCNDSVNDFLPRLKLATTLHFSKGLTGCSTVVVQPAYQSHSS